MIIIWSHWQHLYIALQVMKAYMKTGLHLDTILQLLKKKQELSWKEDYLQLMLFHLSF